MTHKHLLALPALWLMMTQAPSVSEAPAGLNPDLCDIMVGTSVGTSCWYEYLSLISEQGEDFYFCLILAGSWTKIQSRKRFSVGLSAGLHTKKTPICLFKTERKSMVRLECWFLISNHFHKLIHPIVSMETLIRAALTIYVQDISKERESHLRKAHFVVQIQVARTNMCRTGRRLKWTGATNSST